MLPHFNFLDRGKPEPSKSLTLLGIGTVVESGGNCHEFLLWNLTILDLVEKLGLVRFLGDGTLVLCILKLSYI